MKKVLLLFCQLQIPQFTLLRNQIIKPSLFWSPILLQFSSPHQTIIILKMEDHPPVFNYLGEEMMQQHLVDVTRSLQSCFEPGSDQYNKLARYTEKVVQKREKWPDKIFQCWQNRTVPVYSPETITKCNQASPQVRVLKLESSSPSPQVLSQSPSFSLKHSGLSY